MLQINPLIIRLSLAFLSGTLLFLSFPKFGNGWFAWIALIPLLMALKNATSFEAFRTGFIMGMVAHCGILYWIAYVVVQYGKLPFYMGVLAVIALSAYLSLYIGVFSLLLVFMRSKGIANFWVVPLLWTFLEYLRSNLLTGFPWENLAYSQYLQLGIIQIADVTGIYGISFIVVLINTVLYNILDARLNRKKYPLIQIVVACLLLILVCGYGYFRMVHIKELLKQAPPFSVSLIQGNIDQNLKWDEHYQLETLKIYRNLTMEALPVAGGLIVWPETAAPFYFERHGFLQQMVTELTRQSGRPLLFGSPRIQEDIGEVAYLNSAYLLRPDGTIAGRYDKVHLVPYGEYVPLRKYFPFMGKMVTGIGDFRPGRGFVPLGEANRHRLGVLICYEGIFPDAARAYKNNGATLLVNITNDAWFGTTSAPYQHLSMTALRSVENRLYLVRAANTGISAIVDPAGSILSQTELFERTTLNGEVKFIDVHTLYEAYGDTLLFVSIFMLILFESIKKLRGNQHGRTA
jgi:apolipoprotein N-acyltransferase